MTTIAEPITRKHAAWCGERAGHTDMWASECRSLPDEVEVYGMPYVDYTDGRKHPQRISLQMWQGDGPGEIELSLDAMDQPWARLSPREATELANKLLTLAALSDPEID